MIAFPSLRWSRAYMAHHSRSFRFASLMLGGESRGRIERVYGWCRHVDNLVDGPGARALSRDQVEARLDEWLTRSRRAFAGGSSGDPFVDRVMTELRAAGGSLDHPEAVIRGVRSDLAFRRFDDLRALRVYTHDVAAVVGLWLCALHGVREPWMLERAAALGHAMQLTNILRDVGEDLDAGRLYLPLDLLARHGLTAFDLYEMQRANAPVPQRYRALMEDLMSVADAGYRQAWEAIPHLPAEFARAVAVAAAVYAGIHDEIRHNGYDNFTRRAATSRTRKLALAGQALLALRSASRRSGGRGRQPTADEKLRPCKPQPLGAEVVALHGLDG